MTMPAIESVEGLRKAAFGAHIAMDHDPAVDVAARLDWAANEIERLRALVQLALRGLHNDFEPDNQSAIYNRIKAALGNQQLGKDSK